MNSSKLAQVVGLLLFYIINALLFVQLKMFQPIRVKLSNQRLHSVHTK